jgi:hypothetical protein
VRVLEYARSSIFFRIDLDVRMPKTLSHEPPYRMNNARIQIDGLCRVTERATGRLHTFVLGGDCKTERVGADADLFLDPNADFIPLFSDDSFMHIKTFARAGTVAQAYPPGSGEQKDRLTTKIAETFDRVHLDLIEREGELLAGAREIVDAVLANDVLVGIHRFSTERYTAEIEYPIKTINANERDIVYQTDTGPILIPDLDRDPEDLLVGMELAFTASNAPDWAQFVIRTRTPIADGVEVYHYAKLVRMDGIENEFYRIAPASPETRRSVELPAGA